MSDHPMPVSVSRGLRGRGFTLLTPRNRYASRLPDLEGATVFKLVTPRLEPARFAETLVALEPGGGTTADLAPGFEHFFYALRGAVRVGGEALVEGGFAYRPPDARFGFAATAGGPAELLWLKRRLQEWPGLEAPPAVAGHRDDVAFEDVPGVPGLTRRELLDPADPRRDFNMSLLRFEPGVGLDRVEIHDEEHGLYMTAGGGLYFLDGAWHEVVRDDFVYMAPYCPQSFAATGPEPAEYLLYKDVFRDGF